jgi:GT2 family glycosyltransferase
VKCDLILPLWNQLDYTRRCIESLFATVDVPSRLIVVDNGSNDGTGEYLRGLRPPPLIQVETIHNDANRGYGVAVNQGLKIVSAPFVCVLNNDTEFTPRWLSTMIDVTFRDHRIGIVNPESSNFGVRPRKGESILDLAKGLEPQRREFEEIGNCIGFCMLVKRDVLQNVGHFDESYGNAFFEDTDFSMRAKRAGYNCVKACGAYVYHHEHKTIEALPDREKLFAENRSKYEKKWGHIVRIFFPCVFKGKDSLRQAISDLYILARNECYIDFYLYKSKGEPIRDIFRYTDLRPHANIMPKLIQNGSAGWHSFFRILKKRKKPYELLLVNDLDLGHTLSRTHFLHRLPIYMERAGVDDLSKCFNDCHVHIVDNFQKLVAKKRN